MATPQRRRLGYHTPEQVSNLEPPDSRLCVLTTTLLGGGYHNSLQSPTRWQVKFIGDYTKDRPSLFFLCPDIFKVFVGQV